VVRHYGLKKHLENLKTDELRNIAKALGIKNRSRMSSDELRREIWKNMMYGEGVAKILSSLPQSALEILDLVEYLGGNVKKDMIKERYSKSDSTLESNLKKAVKYGALFTLEGKDAEYIQIPKDLMNECSFTLVSVEEKMTFERFLAFYFSREELKYICRKFELPVSGNKSDLVDNIIKKNIHPKEVLEIQKLDDLKVICEMMGLIKSGNKKELVDRMLEHINVAKVKTYKVKKAGSKKPRKEKQQKTQKRRPIFFTRLYNTIDKEIEFIIRPKMKEKDLELQLYQFLSAKFGKEHLIEDQVRTKGGRIDLAFPEEGVGIELKYRPNKASLQRLVQQVEEYNEDFKRIVVVIVAEKEKQHAIEAYKNKIEANPKNKVVVLYR